MDRVSRGRRLLHCTREEVPLLVSARVRAKRRIRRRVERRLSRCGANARTMHTSAPLGGAPSTPLPRAGVKIKPFRTRTSDADTPKINRYATRAVGGPPHGEPRSTRRARNAEGGRRRGRTSFCSLFFAVVLHFPGRVTFSVDSLHLWRKERGVFRRGACVLGVASGWLGSRRDSEASAARRSSLPPCRLALASLAVEAPAAGMPLRQQWTCSRRRLRH